MPSLLRPRAVQAMALLVLVLSPARTARAQELARYTCLRTADVLVIDGKLEERSWREAPASDPFVDIVTGKAAWFPTRVTLLWDHENLYFGFTVPETHVWATLTERDSKIYLDNDVEIFIAGQDAYYEFEVNAHNTVYEVFWIWQDARRPGGRYHAKPEWDPEGRNVTLLSGIGGHVHPRGERVGLLDWDLPGLRSGVHVEGTLNDPSDRDQGWTVEVAMPWSGLAPLAEGRALPPRDGDVWRIDASRFQHIGPGGERLDRAAGWTWNRHGHYDSHIPETFTYVHFSERPAAGR